MIELFRCQLQPRIVRPIEPHEHPFYEFHYIAEGEGSFDLGAQGMRIRKGDFFFQGPGQRHAMRPGAGGAAITQYVCFFQPSRDDDEATGLLASLRSGTVFGLGESSRFLFERLRFLTQSENAHYLFSASHQFLSLLHQLVGERDPLKSQQYHPGVERVIRLLAQPAAQSLRLDDLAAVARLEKRYFVRLFTQQVGISPMRYAMNQRIETAKELLRDPENTLKAVAESLSFCDEYHFSKRFKDLTGLSPSRWRAERHHG